ncbi:hypothetical protein ACOZ4N_15870 [Halorientalis pallida]|uniref:hypothetical protein n=1 Tax=Halorientalis pallida TaxID=2479928 RepID=UPI003C6EFF1C
MTDTSSAGSTSTNQPETSGGDTQNSCTQTIGNVCTVGFSPSGQSSEPLKLDVAAEKMAETVVADAEHKHRNRICGLRLDDREIVTKAGTEDWPQYTVAAGHVLGKLALNLSSIIQFREGGEGFRRAAVNNIANELAGQTVEVRATREDQQPPRGREYRRVEIHFVDGAGTTQIKLTN